MLRLSSILIFNSERGVRKLFISNTNQGGAVSHVQKIARLARMVFLGRESGSIESEAIRRPAFGSSNQPGARWGAMSKGRGDYLNKLT
jgi:hypothetical protein